MKLASLFEFCMVFFGRIIDFNKESYPILYDTNVRQ